MKKALMALLLGIGLHMQAFSMTVNTPKVADFLNNAGAEQAMDMPANEVAVAPTATMVMPTAQKAVVNMAKAEICLVDGCYPVLVGKNTPKGDFTLTLMLTNKRGYGGDILHFHEDAKYIYAIHRVWTLNPTEQRLQRLASNNPADRVITHGCINVAPSLYEKLKGYSEVVVN